MKLLKRILFATAPITLLGAFGSANAQQPPGAIDNSKPQFPYSHGPQIPSVPNHLPLPNSQVNGEIAAREQIKILKAALQSTNPYNVSFRPLRTTRETDDTVFY